VLLFWLRLKQKRLSQPDRVAGWQL
jgi:hypothetical protein